MEALIANIEHEMMAFIEESKKMTNKAAAKRARKLSMSITRDLKEYRKESIK